jgi:hypothetical protein
LTASFMPLKAFCRALVSLFACHHDLFIRKGLSESIRVAYHVSAQLRKSCPVLAVSLQPAAVPGVVGLVPWQDIEVTPCHGSNTHQNIQKGIFSG